MHLSRPHRPLVKPRPCRPLYMMRQDVHDWLNRHGIPDPVLYFAFFEGAGNVAHDLSLSRTRAIFGTNCTWGRSPHGIGLDASAHDLAGPSLPEGTNYPFQLTGDQCTLIGDTIPAFADHTATESYIYDGNGDNNEQIRLLHRDDLLVWRWRVHADASVNCDYEPTHDPGDRLFLVGTYDGSHQRLYQDTGLLNSVSNAGDIVSIEGDLRAIGRGGGAAGGEPFQGVINQLILWDQALAVDQFGLFFEQPYAALQPRPAVVYSFSSALSTYTRDTSWRVRGRAEKDAAWKILADSSQAIAWPVLSESQRNIGWRLLGQADRDLAWQILASGVSSQVISWNILTDMRTDLSWRVLRDEQTGISWRVFTIDSQALAWDLLAWISRDSTWMLLNVNDQEIGWRILGEEIAVPVEIFTLARGAVFAFNLTEKAILRFHQKHFKLD